MVLVIGSTNTLQATHIVGGEMNYTCLGNNEYEITLTIFRDCYNGNPNAWFDDPASIGVFDANNNFLWQILVPLTNNDTLSPVLTSDCLVVPPDVCVHTTTYRTTVELPPISGGYQLAYQRCCRNYTIVNIIDPLDTGATYGVTISEEALEGCNSNPKFQQWPPIYICVNEPIVFDQSAIDQDGDSIVYRLCAPLTGADPDEPMPQPPNNPPYDPVTWVSPPYSEANMLNGFSGGVPLTINPQTGLLVGLPNTIGQFVVGICVEEYRNGLLISTTRRDFQYNVGVCGLTTAAFAAPDIQCGNLAVSFNNNSIGGDDFLWFFDLENNPSATSTIANPVYVYPDTGLYTVMLVSEPGSICSDTAVHTVYLQNNTLYPAFEYAILSCSDTVVIQALDLSEDVTFEIEDWYWSLNPGNQVSSEQNPQFVVNQSGTYVLSLELTSSSGCTQELSQTISVALIEETLTADTLAVCIGDSIFLNEENDPNYSYQWASDPTLSALDVPNPLATPVETTTYQVTITDGICQVEHAVTVIVAPPIELALPPDTTICTTTYAIHLIPVSGYSYSWSSSPDFSDVIAEGAQVTLSPMGPSTYYLLVRDQYGCLAYDSITLTGNAVDALLNGEPAICPGEFGAIGAANLDETDTLTYQWMPASLIIVGQDDPVAFTFLTQPGAYTFSVLLENQYGCTLLDSILQTLIDTSSQLAFTTATQCSGFHVNFYSTSVNAPFYQWHFGEDEPMVAQAVGSSVSHTYQEAGTYQVAVWLSSFISCQDTLWLDVVVEAPQIIPNFAWEISECSDTVVVILNDQSLNSQSDIVSWQWFFSDGTMAEGEELSLTFTESQLLEATLVVQSDDGCSDTSLQIIPITIIDPIMPDSLIFCAGIATFINPNPNPAWQYQWQPAALFEDPNAANPALTLSESQNISVVVSDESGLCSVLRHIAIFVPPPITYTLSSDTSICESEFLLQADSEAAFFYEWAYDPAFSNVFSAEQEVWVEPGMSSSYYLRLIDQYGCQMEDSVRINSQEVFAFLDEYQALCTGDSLQLNVVNLSTDELSYQWSPEAFIVAGEQTATPLVSVAQTQQFSVTLTNEHGCQLVLSTLIDISDVIPPVEVFAQPDTIYEPQQVQLLSTFDEAYTYFWQPGAGVNNIGIYNPIAYVDASKTFKVRVRDENGCTNEAFVTIILVSSCAEPFIFVPNAFTPNGDELNDVFRVEGNTIEQMHLLIYDRWGEKVFEGFRQEDGWDGTFRNRPLPADVYGYYLEVNCFNQEQFIKKGNITLLR
ncbi:MAG TPA: PKD domain-containing protein [Saprospiraceae bacterium]|nr:PKD domain-containing protein [Saprospiraceae bacterium]HMQ84445.1 PKD domain-containing protein [Saprospiraceae bacterium]